MGISKYIKVDVDGNYYIVNEGGSVYKKKSTTDEWEEQVEFGQVTDIEFGPFNIIVKINLNAELELWNNDDQTWNNKFINTTDFSIRYNSLISYISLSGVNSKVNQQNLNDGIDTNIDQGSTYQAL